MALQTITHGEPNWDAKVNALINGVSSLEDGFSSLKISDWSTAGIVIKNGFAFNENSKGYRFVTFPNGKLIEIDVKFRTTGGIKGLVADNVITLPDFVGNNGEAFDAGFWGNQIRVFFIRDWGTSLSIYRTDNDANDEWYGDRFAHAVYFKN